MSETLHNCFISLNTSIISLATTPFKFIYEGTAQRLKTPFTVKADYSLPFVFNLSVLVFIHHITLMPQRLLFFTTLFERHHVVSLLERQAILTGSALFPCSAMLLKNSNKFQRHGIPLKRLSTCVIVTVISI